MLGASFNVVTKISSSKQSSSSSERLGEAPLDLGKLHVLLSISLSRSGDFLSKLSIRSLKVFLYLLGIATISDFSSPPSTAYLSTCFRKIVTILFQRRRGVLAHVFPRRAYAPVKQTLNIGNIVHWSFAYQSPLFEPMTQIKLWFLPSGRFELPKRISRSLIITASMMHTTLIISP